MNRVIVLLYILLAHLMIGSTTCDSHTDGSNSSKETEIAWC